MMSFNGGFGRLVGLVWKAVVGRSDRPVGWSW